MAKKQLSTDYFQGELTVGQLTEPSGAVATNLGWFIAKYEEDYLKLLLGVPLYDAYVAGMAAPVPESRWTILDDKLYKVQGNVKLSPAANYVYWFYQRNEVTNTTGTGEKLVTTENSKNVGSGPKVKLAWNAMINLGNDIVNYLKRNAVDYPLYADPVWDTTSEETKKLYKDRMNILKTIIPFF